MKYRDDIDPYNTWVVSDTHFGHENIVGFCHRPLDHDQVMIAEWRKEVPDDATVLHLGDLSYRSNAHFKHIVAPELTGARKLLILGNHDKQGFGFYKQCGFKVAKPFKLGIEVWGREPLLRVRPTEANEDGFLPEHCRTQVSFSHYPWNAQEDGDQGPYDWRLHGHIHNSGYSRDKFVPFLRNHINLSIEQTKYRPVNLGLLLEAVLLGKYPETTDEQLEEARSRKEANRA